MSPSKTLVLRELQRQSGQKTAEIAERLRITPKHVRKMLCELSKEGHAGMVCCSDGRRWYLAHEVESVRKQVKAEMREARRYKNIVKLIEWRASKKAPTVVVTQKPANSVFALGAL